MKRASFALVLTALLAGHARSDIRRFAYTYSWFTSAKGERELELTATRIDRGSWLSENELEFGVTDRYTVAPYLVFAHDQGSTVEGWQVEQRLRLGDFHTNHLLPALYLEVSKVGADPYELEGRLIGSYAPKGPYFVSANLITTQGLAQHEALGWGYSIGATRIQGRYWMGAEAMGSFSERQHWIGPSAGVELSNQSRLIGAFGLGLNGQAPQAKVLFAVEF